jgi:AcrR family transcriptional regulator
MTAVDGRTERGARNREAIADALLGFYEEGDLQPSVPDIAARAGVSVRSVHNHFADVESMRAEVAERQWQRHAHLIEPVSTINEMLEQRIAFFEAVTPVRRAALLSVHDSPTIAKNLARLDRILRRQLDALLPELGADTLEMLDLLTSWDAWNRLRAAQGLSVARARRVLERTITELTEGNSR